MPVSLTSFRRSIPNINSWLLAALFFCIPIQVAPAYNISALMLVLWLIEGNFKQKWNQLKGNPIFWIFQAYFWIFALSLLWTENMQDGKRMVLRNTFFLLSPVFLTVARKEHIERYIHAFLASIVLCELLAYYNFIKLHFMPRLPTGIMVSKSLGDTAPFVDRILYAPALAFAGYLSAYKALKAKGSHVKKALYLFLLLATAGNLVFSGGRTGQLAFILLMMLLAFQHFSGNPWKGMAVASVFAVVFFGMAYTINDNFRKRADLAVEEVSQYQEMAGKKSMNASSAGLRLTYWRNSFEIVTEHPILGVGAGDFTSKYAKVNQRLTPAVIPVHNPHSQYLFVLTTTGVVGGIILLLAYLPPGFWRRKSSDWPEIRTALALFFMFISLLESYLWRSNTCLMFIVFSSMIYGKAKVRHVFAQDAPINKS